MPRKRSRGNDAIERTPLGNRIVRNARVHGTNTHFSKNLYLKLYRGGKITCLPLFERKKRSTDLADDIKNYLRRNGKTIEDVKREFFDGVREPSALTADHLITLRPAIVGRTHVRTSPSSSNRSSRPKPAMNQPISFVLLIAGVILLIYWVHEPREFLRKKMYSDRLNLNADENFLPLSPLRQATPSPPTRCRHFPGKTCRQSQSHSS